MRSLKIRWAEAWGCPASAAAGPVARAALAAARRPPRKRTRTSRRRTPLPEPETRSSRRVASRPSPTSRSSSRSTRPSASGAISIPESLEQVALPRSTGDFTACTTPSTAANTRFSWRSRSGPTARSRRAPIRRSRTALRFTAGFIITGAAPSTPTTFSSRSSGICVTCPGHSRTTIVGPLVNRVAPDENDNWLAPLYFTGKRKNGGYTLIPAAAHLHEHERPRRLQPRRADVLFLDRRQHLRRAHGRRASISAWRPSTSTARTPRRSTKSSRRFFTTTTTTIARSAGRTSGASTTASTRNAGHAPPAPALLSIDGKNEHHTTLLPFFHYGYDRNSWLLINPLFLAAEGLQGESTFVTYLYARYRGRTTLDMVTPLYWRTPIRTSSSTSTCSSHSSSRATARARARSRCFRSTPTASASA